MSRIHLHTLKAKLDYAI